MGVALAGSEPGRAAVATDARKATISASTGFEQSETTLGEMSTVDPGTVVVVAGATVVVVVTMMVVVEGGLVVVVVGGAADFFLAIAGLAVVNWTRAITVASKRSALGAGR